MRNKALLAGVILILAPAAMASIIEDFESADSLDDWTANSTQAGWFDMSLTAGEGVSSSQALDLRMGGSGGTDSYFTWDLGGTYDFWQGGSPDTSVYSKTWSQTVVDLVRFSFLDKDGVNKALVDFTPNGTMTQYDLDTNFNGDETAITQILVTIRRDDNSSTLIVFNDNFSSNAIPEPATMGLLGIGGLFALRRRR